MSEKNLNIVSELRESYAMDIREEFVLEKGREMLRGLCY